MGAVIHEQESRHKVPKSVSQHFWEPLNTMTARVYLAVERVFTMVIGMCCAQLGHSFSLVNTSRLSFSPSSFHLRTRERDIVL